MAHTDPHQGGAPTDAAVTARTFTLLLITVLAYLLIWQGVSRRADLPVYYYGRLIELLGIFLFMALALTTPMRFADMGILTDRRTLLRSLALGGAVALLAVGGSALVALFRHAEPLFSWHVRGDISRLTYFLVAPLQEVLSKSVMYYCFERCLGRAHPWRVNLLCAVGFGIFHVVYGLRMMLLAMLLTLVTGAMFRRVRCVWGCAVAHFAFGFFPLCFGL